jgi:hypothetical protein
LHHDISGEREMAVSSRLELDLSDSKSPVLPLHYETTEDLTAVVAVALGRELE